MEAANEEGSLLSSIIPPRLEDAGLEDCALSHDSIKEAFLKAANSLKSWAPTDPDSEDEDPRGELGLPDSLIGVKPAFDPPSSSCSNEKGNGLPEVIGDEVCVGGDGNEISEKESDRILGLNGLKIDDNNNEDDEEENESENPILVVQNGDLYQQIGRDVYCDLVDHDKVRSFRVHNSMPFSSFKETVVGQFSVPMQLQRYWMWLKSENQTCRPYRPLTHEEEKPVGQLKWNKTPAAELILLLQSLELVLVLCTFRRRYSSFLAIMTLKKKKIWKSIELNQTTKIRRCRSRRL
ncbi:hypothetical protein MKW92_045919, partial [Papaver armeniacum]